METILRKEIVVNKTAVRVIAIVTFIILTCLGAFVRIPLPFTPVPITLQTFFVLLAGAFLGRSLGVATQAGYILLGILGLPVFSQAGYGFFYLLGPTGGYILGFIFAAYFIGKFIRYTQNNIHSVFFIFLIADFIILASGVIWMKLIFQFNLGKLLVIGFLPFIPGDLLKISIASVIYLKLKNRLKEIIY